MTPFSKCSFNPVSEMDRTDIIDLFNYYISNSFAAYPEEPVPYGFFDLFLAACRQYPSVSVRLPDGTLAGFGMLRYHNPMPAFRYTAEVTTFLRPDMTGKGLGTEILARLERDGKAQGIRTVLASISSLNEGSIRFHARNGFCECGRFVEVGVKNGKIFDTVWMQKSL